MRNVEILTQTQENIITLQELKDYLEITDDTQDAALNNLIDAASSYIKTQTGYEWVETEYKAIIDGNGNNSIVLSQRPVQLVDSITVNDELLDSADFVVYKTEGIVTRKNQVFYEGLQNVEVLYTGGYTSVPGDLKQACKDMIKAKINNDGYEGLSAYEIGDESIKFEENNEIPGKVLETISSHSKKRW